MKAPEECADVQDIRSEIDHIDKEIITLIGRRFEYVKAAAKFKTDETNVKSPERVEAMLRHRRAWAEEAGLDPDVIEKLYRDLVSHFIQKEMAHWKESSYTQHGHK